MLVASIAMQESTCNPKVQGGGGEQGMMQITKDKCKGAPGGDCKDVVCTLSNSLCRYVDIYLKSRTSISESGLSTWQVC